MCVGLGSMQFVLENGQQYDWFDDARIRWFTFFSVAGVGGIRLVDAALDYPGRRSSCLEAAAGCGGKRARRGARRQPLRLDHHSAAVSYQLARLYGDALGRDGDGSRAARCCCFTPLTAILTQRGLVDPRLQAAIGFVLLSISNWMLGSITTPLSDFHSLILPLILSGIGLAQIFVPLSVAVIGSVPDKEVPSTAAFFNLSRQIGGSVAAAILITLLVRGFTVHQTELASFADPGAPADPTVRAPARRHAEPAGHAAARGSGRVAIGGRNPMPIRRAGWR